MRALAIASLVAACAAPVLALACAAPGGSAEPADGGAAQGPRRAVVLLAGDAAELESELRRGWLFRRVLPRRDDWQVGVRTREPIPQGGESGVAVVAALLPVPDEIRELVRDLPVELGGEELFFDGTRYGDPAASLALRLPGAGERWLVAAAHPEGLLEGVSRNMARLLGGIRYSDDGADGDAPVDYELRSRPWRLRRGRWAGPGPDGRHTVDPAAERDDFAARERWLDALRPVGSGSVRLLVPPGEEGSAELRELAASLGSGAAAMAARVPLDPRELHDRPVTVAVEADHVAQIRHADAVGHAVSGSGGGAPALHVVAHPEDRWAYRHAVARELLERSGAAAGHPPWLVQGAALWLAATVGEGSQPGGAGRAGPHGGWYGRPYRDWLPALAAAGVLPDPEVLLDPEGPASRSDGSEVLWTPAAAAVIDRLPGDTVEERLAAADQATVVRVLAALEDEVSAAAGSSAGGGAGAAPGPAPEATAQGSPLLPRRFLRGVSLGMSNSIDGGYHAPAVGERLDELAALGADAVSLMPFAFQPRPDAPELRYLNGSPSSETDAGLIHAARQAHRRGFAVLWKPHLWLGRGSWPGEVAMTSEADWDRWWRTYRRYVLHHAVLAAYAEAELFAVGVELERTVERRDDWLALIRDVRRVYPGVVTYAGNWGQGAERVRFWDALDVVGVDAYYPLVDGGDGDGEVATDAQLARGAAAVADRLEALARRTGKPVLLTEVGFAAREAAWLAPHEEGGELAPEDQARAYRALLGALEGRPWLRGVFVWKAMSGPVVRPGLEAPRFRFLGHPAEGVIAGFFRRQAAPEAAGGL